MKVSVLGAGAIGSMFGGLIKHFAPETEVVLITRGEHLRRINEQGGIRILGYWGDVTVDVEASEDPKLIEGSDFVLLTVKSYSTETAMTQAKPFLGDATLISIQNGFNQSTLASFIPPERSVMGMTATSMALVEPGTVELRRNGISVIGPASDSTPLDVVQSASDVLSRSDLAIKVDPNIVGAQYNKLIANTLGVASTLTGSPLIPDAILDTRWRNQVALPLQLEAIRVLEHANIPLSNVPDGSNVWKFRRLLRLMNVPVLGSIIKSVVWMLFRKKPMRFSIGEDLRRGRATEIDYINGELVRLAESVGTTAPRNAKIMELVDQLAKTGRSLSLDELSEQFEKIA